jgi:hypothetical protein
MADRNACRVSLLTFRTWPFGLVAGAFLLHAWLEQIGLLLPFLQYYLNDLLCMPLVLTVTLFLQRAFTFRNPSHVFTKHQVGIAVAYYALAFEGILPLFMARYTADVLDIAAYGLGGVFFYRYLNVAPALSARN